MQLLTVKEGADGIVCTIPELCLLNLLVINEVYPNGTVRRRELIAPSSLVFDTKTS